MPFPFSAWTTEIPLPFQDPAQMCLARDNDVVHTFTPDRSDQPFGKWPV